MESGGKGLGCAWALDGCRNRCALVCMCVCVRACVCVVLSEWEGDVFEGYVPALEAQWRRIRLLRHFGRRGAQLHQAFHVDERLPHLRRSTNLASRTRRDAVVV